MHSEDCICKKTREMQHSTLKISPCQPLSNSSQSPENWGLSNVSQPVMMGELASEPNWCLPHKLLWSNCRAAPHYSMDDLDLAAHQKFSCEPWLLPWPRTLSGGTFFPDNTLDNEESGFPIKRQPNGVYLQSERESCKWCSPSLEELCQLIPLSI